MITSRLIALSNLEINPVSGVWSKNSNVFFLACDARGAFDLPFDGPFGTPDNNGFWTDEDVYKSGSLTALQISNKI